MARSRWALIVKFNEFKYMYTPTAYEAMVGNNLLV